MAGTKDKYRAIAPYFTKKPVAIILSFLIPFFFKQKTAYDMAQCDWSSDVCSSDLSVTLVGEVVPESRLEIGAESSARGIERSEERRVGKECIEPWRSRWWADH